MNLMNYHFPDMLINDIRAELKKQFKSIGQHKQFKAKGWKQVWFDLLVKGAMPQDISTAGAFTEFQWLKNPVSYVPESKELLDDLKDIKVDGIVGMSMAPADVFSVAMPKDYLVNNQSIKGCFVSWMSEESVIRSMNDVAASCGYKDLSMSAGEWPYQNGRFNLSYKDPEGFGRIVVTLSGSKIPQILLSKNHQEYSERVGESDMGYGLSDQEKKTQFEMLKIAISLMVYMKAHTGSTYKLDSILAKPVGMESKTRMSPIGVKHFTTKRGVAPHYRQLRDQRFYQGEHSDLEAGSRWVPVNMDCYAVDRNI